ncbi:methyl-accepting chemotaxis protein, partial [Burkholderia glumae]|nr:methyl-accepting chemotaxis protein [Burkholderia glumae]
ALVEQATAAAQSMADQAESLRATVSIFRVDAKVQTEPGVAVKRQVSVAPKQAKRRPEPARVAAPAPAAAGAGSDEWATF